MVARTPHTSTLGDHERCDLPSTQILRRNFGVLWQSVAAYDDDPRKIVLSFSTCTRLKRRLAVFKPGCRLSFKATPSFLWVGKRHPGLNRLRPYYDSFIWLFQSYLHVPSPGSPLDRVDDSAVTSDISPDDLSAALKRLTRDKPAGTHEIDNTFYRDYADTLGPGLATVTPDGLGAACSRRRLMKRIFSV